MPSFVPVQDPEKARSEQDEESLRKHRQFDTPFALLPKDLNNPKEKKGDLNPIAKRSEELYQDENKLWKKKREVFDKQQTWGRETAIWSNPEETRDKDKRKYKPGEVFWGAKGTFGGKSEDSGLLTLQRGEVDQTMELNEKGLWVRKKKPTEEAPGLSASAKQLLKASSSVEDPRLEAAKPKGRGTADASEKALQALQERRQLERKVADEMGMTNKGMKPQHRSGPVTTLNNSSQQCRPSKRHAGMKRWQGVQRSDEEAKEIVEKALGSCAVGGEAPKRMEPSQTSNKRNRSPSPVLGLSSPSGSEKEDDGKFEAAWMDSDDEREASKLNQKPSGGDIVVDFF
ncbi:Dual specificity protein phosphatase 9 [Durusdinium trenchii]|uniref:Dual specificity protein phosphatase 9 n=1 Tax=Durusdinium trenchii TaxID=1381693 RepID=A0ABP0PSZ4_9DINO